VVKFWAWRVDFSWVSREIDSRIFPQESAYLLGIVGKEPTPGLGPGTSFLPRTKWRMQSHASRFPHTDGHSVIYRGSAAAPSHGVGSHLVPCIRPRGTVRVHRPSVLPYEVEWLIRASGKRCMGEDVGENYDTRIAGLFCLVQRGVGATQ
jgi:hypothetical protein